VASDWRSSVRTRVTAGAISAIAVTLVVTVMTTSGLLRRSLTNDTESVLADRIDGIEALAADGSLPAVLDVSGHEIGQLEVIDSSGVVVALTPGIAGHGRFDVIPAPPVGTQTTATVDGGVIGTKKGEKFRLVARTVSSPVGVLTIYATATISAATRAERYLQLTLLIGSAILLVIASFGIWLVVGRAFAPVDAMRAEVDRIEATDLSMRVRPGSSDNEVATLGATLNRLLDRLEEAATRQRLFSAAASHELRSPLAAIRTEVEVGLLYPEGAAWRTIGEDVLIEVARLEALSHDLRTLTRSNAVDPAQRCNLAVLVADEIGRRRPPKGIAYETNLESAVVVADSDAVVQVLRNLFDNAERHSASIVLVRLQNNSNSTRLSVWNDGERIPPDERDRIFEAFRRLDEARALDTGGSGLGLAIARTIMHGFGGSLIATDVQEGAEFVASFPRTSTP
jgi:signal transduction histidine kinase